MSTRRATLARVIVPGALVLVLVLAGCSSPSSSVGLESDAGGASDTVSVLSDGSKGPQGAPGADGKPGIQGPIGLRGAPGPAGPQGIQGPRGPAGPAGSRGPAGADGRDGSSASPLVFTSSITRRVFLETVEAVLEPVITVEGVNVSARSGDPGPYLYGCVNYDEDDEGSLSECEPSGSVTVPSGSWLIRADLNGGSDAGNPSIGCQFFQIDANQDATAIPDSRFAFAYLSDNGRALLGFHAGQQAVVQSDGNSIIRVHCSVDFDRTGVGPGEDDFVQWTVNLSALSVASPD